MLEENVFTRLSVPEMTTINIISVSIVVKMGNYLAEEIETGG